MKGKIYIKTIKTQYEDESYIGEVVEILSNSGEVKFVICDKKDSHFFTREPRYCMRIKSLDDPTPYYKKKKKEINIH